MLLAGALGLCCAFAHDSPESVQTQKAREKWVKAKGYKVYYTNKFDLTDLPEYSPQQKVSGTIRMWGSNYFTDSPLAEYWQKDFQNYQPDVKFDFHLKTSEHAVSALIFGVSDIGPMGRQIMWDEQLAFQRQFGYLPLGIVAVTGSYDVSGWNPPIGVYLNSGNPLTRLSLQQLDGIFGAERSGAWRDLSWDKSLDEAIFDAANHRVYAPGGEGYIASTSRRILIITSSLPTCRALRARRPPCSCRSCIVCMSPSRPVRARRERRSSGLMLRQRTKGDSRQFVARNTSTGGGI